MKLSRACAYAVRALVFLARREGGGPATAATIAAAEGLPEGFLRRALTDLTGAGVLAADLGGFCLARPARDVALLEVVEAVEGPVRGQAPGVVGPEGAGLEAELQRVCDDAAWAVRCRLRRVSLADLAGEGE
jgi:Rrf2 family protein